MTRRDLLLAPSALALQSRPAYEVGAYYFPNYHPDPRNDRTHGRGWTEWELLKRAQPRFPGHIQPRTPLWGYEDESNPAVFQKKIDTAAGHGLTHFIFDWYWYDDGPFLNAALDRGDLGAPNNSRLKFALMWANHDWTEIMPARLGLRAPVLYPGAVSFDAFDRMTDRIVTRYFAHKSYWKPGGKPYFSIYELYRFIDSMGGLDNARKVLDHLRAVAGGIHLNAVLWGVRPINNTFQSLDANQVLQALAVDSVTSYVWLHHAPLKDFPASSYATLTRDSVAFWSKAAREFKVPFHPNVTMGWDSTPRTCQSDFFENRGYPFTPVVTGNTPQAFRSALEQARAFLDSRPGHRILNINAWNEWTEGSYLEPDTLNGLSYLQAVRDVFPPPRP